MASYTEATGLAPDFRVSYRLFSAEEGGRKTPPFQGILWDFSYADEQIGKPNQVFMIWPEFVSDSGQVLPKGELVPKQSLADMFILNPTFRAFHCQHIKVGVKGYFHEGKKIGTCEVVKVLALHQNPKS